MTRYVIINNGTVINTIEAGDNYTSSDAVQSDTANIGDSYNDNIFTIALVASSIKAQARALLNASDMVAMRCMKAGLPFPVEWQNYVITLRAIMLSGSGELPNQPDYPSGT